MPLPVQVVLSAQPRPAAEQMLVVTDPAVGVRPDVPAGYGTGFEHGLWGRGQCSGIPISTLARYC
jgi:hypothetical protein